MYVIDQCKQLTRLAILTRDDGGKTRKGTRQEDGYDIGRERVETWVRMPQVELVRAAEFWVEFAGTWLPERCEQPRNRNIKDNSKNLGKAMKWH